MNAPDDIDWQPHIDRFFGFFAQTRLEKDTLTITRLREIFLDTVKEAGARVVLLALRTNADLWRLLKEAADVAHPKITQELSAETIAGYVANTIIDALEMDDEQRVELPSLAEHGDSLVKHEEQKLRAA